MESSSNYNIKILIMRTLTAGELNRIKQIPIVLSRDFIFSQPVARIIQLAMITGRGALMYGLGGNGKSVMVEAALKWVAEDENDVFIKSFSSDTQPAELYGGPDLQKLNEENKLEFATQFSFLNSRYFIAEEFGDAPGATITSLKDTLSSGKLRNGAQVVPGKTEVMFGLTNVDPQEIAEKGDAYEALTQRFPLRLEVEWKEYNKNSFSLLFDKVREDKGEEIIRAEADDSLVEVPRINGEASILAEMLGKTNEEGNYVSPRVAIFAMEVCQAAAMLRGASKVELSDLVDLKFVMGLEHLGENIQSELNAARERSLAADKIAESSSILLALKRDLELVSSPIKCNQISLKADKFRDGLAELKVTDDLVSERKRLREEAEKLSIAAMEKSKSLTKV